MLDQPGVQDAEHRADDPLGGEDRLEFDQRIAVGRDFCASLIDDLAEGFEPLRAALQDVCPGAERLHDQERPQPGLIPDELKQGRQSGPDFLPPALLVFIGRTGNCREPGGRFVEHTEKAVFAVLEHLVERLARNPGAARHPRYGHAAVAQLGDDLHRSGEDPRPLQLCHLGTRRAIRAPRHARSTPHLRRAVHSA